MKKLIWRNMLSCILLLWGTSFTAEASQGDEIRLSASDNMPDTTCNVICCDSIRYCGITQLELFQCMARYRDDIWAKTSKIAATNVKAYTATDSLDARFMETSIEELENYICTVKRMAAERNTSVSSIRFYYIKYPGKLGEPGTKTNAYPGCHSIAMVPVSATTGKDLIIDATSTFVPGQCVGSSIENHNHLCPPMTGCNLSNTLIPIVDQ